MKIYFDVSCLNRPFDDQSQPRVRVETEAVLLLLADCHSSTHQHVSSEMAIAEIEAISDARRRLRVRQLLPKQGAIMEITAAELDRAAQLMQLGMKPADAVHLAAAEHMDADVLLSCDDRFCRTANRHRASLRVSVLNPLDWLRESQHGHDA